MCFSYYFKFLIEFKFLDELQTQKMIFERTWLSNFIKTFVEVLYTIPESEEGTKILCNNIFFPYLIFKDNIKKKLFLLLVNSEVLAYVERCLEFLIDLEAQLPTRRYFNKLLEDHQILTLCKFAPIMKRDVSKLVN